MLDDAVRPKGIALLAAIVRFTGFQNAIAELIHFFGHIGLLKKHFGDGVEPSALAVECAGNKEHDVFGVRRGGVTHRDAGFVRRDPILGKTQVNLGRRTLTAIFKMIERVAEAAVLEPAAGVLGGDGGQRRGDGRFERFLRARLALRRTALSLAKACSMGLKSGL